jgi:hypothetical protein
MKKKILITSAIVASTVIFTGCGGAMNQMMSNGLGQQMMQGSTNSQAANLASGNATTENKNCVPRMGGGSVSMFDMASKLVLNPLIESAIEEASGEKVKIPAKLLSTCEADEKLKYVEALTNRYYDNLNLASTKFINSMEETAKVRQYKAEMADQKGMEDKADNIEGKQENLEKMFALMETAKIKDKKLFSEASGIFTKTTTLFTPQLLGWDKEIAEFSKDNLVWGVKNISALKTLLTQVGTIAKVPVTGAKLVETAAASSNISISQKDAKLAAAKIKVPSEKELQAESAEM